MESFSGREIATQEELLAMVREAFADACGEVGKDEFEQYVVPAVLQIYGTNFSKAGIEFLEIINEGSNLSVEGCVEHFRTYPDRVKDRLEFSGLDKETVYQELVRTIGDVLLVQGERFERRGVVGAVLFGSWARKELRKDSDVDLVPVIGSDQEGEDDEDGYVNYADDFERQLNRRISHIVQMRRDSIFLKKEEELGDISLFADGVVLSPYPEVKERVEDLLKGG